MLLFLKARELENVTFSILTIFFNKYDIFWDLQSILNNMKFD